MQCLCDADCPLNSRCHTVSGNCVAENFCTTAAECEALIESCDRAAQLCQPRCDDDNDCEVDEYCKIVPYVQPSQEDYVCRPRSELPCLNDSFEPNQTADEAIANARALPLPAMGESIDVPNLSLCDFDTEDWFTLALAAGDHVDIRGTSLTAMTGDMKAYLADAVSLLDTGVFSSGGSELLSFTAQRAGLYLVRVSLGSAATGLYNLNIRLTQGALCSDGFEDATGANDSPADATPLNDPAPAACTLTGSLGSTHTVSCTGAGSRICPFEVDYYWVSAHAGATVTLQLTGLGANLDMTLYGPYASGESVDTSRQRASS
ncbi:MAG: PPC domain-containing protein, partial [Deltaproteobacteria bacterium]|nr:PPC domain-containing protein [Deltaproteobacteria bacterium]